MHVSNPHEPLNLSSRTTFFHDNVIIMEVNNLLAGWPTYTINFTPERPGPLKLILRLKDASKFRSTEDDDSEDEAEGAGASKEDADVTMVCEAMSKDAPQRFSAKPVQLHGIPKDPPSVVTLQEKFEQENIYTWPPCCGFRKMSAEVPLNHVDAFMTLPAAVAALKLD
ncbi:uncharacterized protein EDB91DRAFT_1087812 [Suillus paluster]|uniref:uncharacterized protein n=1 Tax=Suillus paluster TaxID=48578 RepID=UPI001B881C56|nr:uncharacterized protein EDB91DRAFT_1087812 [Suillus paluster]KAG1723413.1 hypothetical protein EDB91DRAFT_1087812 [Suillus paluster]